MLSIVNIGHWKIQVLLFHLARKSLFHKTGFDLIRYPTWWGYTDQAYFPYNAGYFMFNHLLKYFSAGSWGQDIFPFFLNRDI